MNPAAPRRLAGDDVVELTGDLLERDVGFALDEGGVPGRITGGEEELRPADLGRVSQQGNVPLTLDVNPHERQ